MMRHGGEMQAGLFSAGRAAGVGCGEAGRESAPDPSLPPVPSPGLVAGAKTTPKASWFGQYYYLPC